MTLKEKLYAIFGSIRFWQLAVIAILQILVILNVLDGAQAEAIVRIIQGLIGGSVVIGTIDSTAVKYGEAVGTARALPVGTKKKK